MRDTSGTADVVLFPLCDSQGDLVSLLRDARHEPGTRADALVFAWLLNLPDHMKAADAAAAVLAVAHASGKPGRTGRQKTMMRELQRLVSDNTARGRPGLVTAGWSSVSPSWSVVENAEPRSVAGRRPAEH